MNLISTVLLIFLSCYLCVPVLKSYFYVYQFSCPVSMCTSSPVLFLIVPVLLCCFYLYVPVLMSYFYVYQFSYCFYLCLPVLLSYFCLPVLKSCFYVYQFSCAASICVYQFSCCVLCTSSPVLLLSVCTSSPVLFLCVPVHLCCFYLCVPVFLSCFLCTNSQVLFPCVQLSSSISINVYQFSCPVTSSQVLFPCVPVLNSYFLVYQFSTPISLCTRSPVPGHMPPLPVSPASSSSGSDTASMTEFRQVKLHAQNQILLLKVLSDEKEQVTMVVQHAAARSPFIPRIFVGYVDL